jgi:hypothetical protein
MSRCMRDETSTNEYPNPDQRLAVCSSLYKKNNKEEYSMSDIEKMGDAIKNLTDVISSKAKIGDGSTAKPKKPESEAFIGTSAMDEDDMEKEARSEDMFDNQEDARAKAKEIGCVGTHTVWLMVKQFICLVVHIVLMKKQLAKVMVTRR